MIQQKRVALLMQSTSAYGRGILRGIGSYIREHRHWTVYQHVGSIPKSLPANLQEWGPDGIIGQFETRELIKQAKRFRVPLVDLYALHKSRWVSCLDVDHDAVTRLVLEHFESLGHQHFAYCGFKGVYYCERRCKAFASQLKEKGATMHLFQSELPKTRLEDVYDIESHGMFDITRIGHWLKGLPKPLALLAGTDIRARQVLEACRMQGIDVPGEVSVSGVGNDEVFCHLSNPTLTSVALSAEATGRDAARLLDQMMAGQPPLDSPKYYGPRCIVPRESTNSLMISDPLVSSAVDYIRQQIICGTQIGVIEAARHVGLSRSTLQRRFAQALGCSPRDEIIRLQIERIRELLRETNHSLESISNQMGFNYPNCMIRLFRRKTGETPTTYRRRMEGL